MVVNLAESIDPHFSFLLTIFAVFIFGILFLKFNFNSRFYV